MSIAIPVSNLPSPPYQPINEGDRPKPRGKKPVILESEAVRVRQGDEYDFITTGVIERIRVEKIWQDDGGNCYVIISQRIKEGRKTHALHISEFRQRCVAGGIKEVSI